MLKELTRRVNGLNCGKMEQFGVTEHVILFGKRKGEWSDEY